MPCGLIVLSSVGVLPLKPNDLSSTKFAYYQALQASSDESSLSRQLRRARSIDFGRQATEYGDEIGFGCAVQGALFNLICSPHPRARGIVAHRPFRE